MGELGGHDGLEGRRGQDRRRPDQQGPRQDQERGEDPPLLQDTAHEEGLQDQADDAVAGVEHAEEGGQLRPGGMVGPGVGLELVVDQRQRHRGHDGHRPDHPDL